MKKIISFATAFVAISLVSCMKEKTAEVPDFQVSATGIACISAQADFLALGTRSLSSYTTLESGDLKIDRYDIAFFNGTNLVREISVSNAGITDGQIPDTTVTLPVGTYKVYLAANAYTSFGDLSILDTQSGASLGSFELGSDPESILWDLSNDAYDNDGNLVQVAAGTVTVGEGTTLTAAATANLQLKRRVVRIRVNSITNKLPSGMDVELEAVYLSNTSIKDLLFSDSNYMSTYNKYYLCNLDGNRYRENTGTGLKEWKTIGEYYYDSVNDEGGVNGSSVAYKGISRVLSGGSSYSTPFNLYCYRNPATAYKSSASDFWDILGENVIEYDGSGAPATQLVIAAGIGTEIDEASSPRTMVYYPITLVEAFPEGLKPNHTYTLDISLNNLGSSDPSEHISYGAASVTASVCAWNDGGVSTVEM